MSASQPNQRGSCLWIAVIVQGLVLAGVVLVLVGVGGGWLDLPWQEGDAPATTSAPAAESGATVILPESEVAAVYAQASPSVVNVTSRSISYDFYLGPMPQEGTGSGFIYDDQGHVVTNYHVIEGSDSVQVTLAGGETLPARVVGADPSNDLAVLQITEEADLQFLPLGQSDQVQIGQFVVAIGSPFGLEQTLTLGVVSATGRVIQSPNNRFIGEIIQTDASINPGNSGGPLLNLAGEVIGVTTAILSPSGTSAGIGFAIPARTVQRVVPELIESGAYPHPWLGVQLLDITPQRAESLAALGVELPATEGVLVVETVPGSPAEQAGIRGGSRQVRVGNLLLPVGGDVIIAADGEPIESRLDLTLYLESSKRVGDVVELTVLRDGQEQVVPVPLAEQPIPAGS